MNRRIKYLEVLDYIIIIMLYIFSFSLGFSRAIRNFSFLILIFCYILKKIKIKNFKIKLNLFGKVSLLAIAAILTSFIGNGQILPQSREFLFKYFNIFIMFRIILEQNLDLKKIKKMFILIILGINVNLILVFPQAFFQNEYRPSGFLDVMQFAALIMIAIMLILFFITFSKIRLKYKIILFIILILDTVSLILNNSRGTWMALLFTIGICFFIRNWKKGLIYLFVVSFILSISIIKEPKNIYVKRFVSIINIESDKSNSTRLNLWKGAINIFLDNPINGVGMGNFKNLVGEDKYKAGEIITKVHAHNNIFNLMAETGVLGVFAYILLTLFILIKIFNFYKKEEDINIKTIYYSTFAIIICVNLQGVTEVNYISGYIIRVLWLIIILTLAIEKKRKLI